MIIGFFFIIFLKKHMIKRTAREISIKSELINNKKISAKIGVTENRDSPQTIYINVNFWIKPINDLSEDRKFLEKKLESIINGKLIDFLKNNYFFPITKHNIYICNIPENFNYNDKFNYVFLEVYLHTLNINSECKYPLNTKKNTELYTESLKICNFIGDNLKDIENNFDFKKSSKVNKLHC